ncbi:HAD-IA family hydrolase [Thermolongibacillus altinsuensis]
MYYEALMFDLDQTLVDTSRIEKWRKQKQWEECFRHFHLTKLYPHVQAFLKSVPEKKIAIVTNSPFDYAKQLLQYHQIKYDKLIAYQKNGRNKPYPDQLLCCADKLRLNPDKCIYIGDEPSDIAAAKAAGFTVIAFSPTMEKAKQLIPLLPDTVISGFPELEQFLNKQENPLWQKKLNVLLQCAEREKKKRNGKRYYDYLKEASSMGHGPSQYRLAKLLKKNPFLVEGDKNDIYFMWQAAKRMVPEAIYELGDLLEKENQPGIARNFYRAAAHLGCPHAQFRFGKAKLKTPSSCTKLNIAYKWIKQSYLNGLEKAKTLLDDMENIIEFETALRNRLLYDKSHVIFYVNYYIPEERYQDEFSKKILQVKNEGESAIAFFVQLLNPLLTKELVLCYVPSSEKEKTITGIRKIAEALAVYKGMDGTDCLIRWKTKEKSSLGGERSIEAHLQTMMVQNKEMIEGKHVFLLDDVTTSGSSLTASEILLLESGALHVTKLALGKTKSK